MADEDRRRMFSDMYQERRPPWDTGITPPEIVTIIDELPPGRALDLGCGTGTNMRYLLQQGWQVDGLDFVQQAVNEARRKLAEFPKELYGVYCHDVTRLEELPMLRPPYDLAVDIGCGHSVPPPLQTKYVAGVAEVLRPGGDLMLYTHEPSEGRSIGWTPSDVKRLFAGKFEIIWQVLSDDTSTGWPSGWYRLAKRG